MKPDDKELTYEEQQNVAHGFGEKVPFPAMDEIEWDNDVGIHIYLDWVENVVALIENFTDDERYTIAKLAYENGVKVTWKLKEKTVDKHANIKAEYAKAKEAEKNGGPIVKLFWRHAFSPDAEYCDTISPSWDSDCEYQLRYYNINWEKVLAWSYANGEFVECEFRQAGAVEWTIADLVGKYGKYFINDKYTTKYEDCRPAPDVEIQDEWLEEIK